MTSYEEHLLDDCEFCLGIAANRAGQSLEDNPYPHIPRDDSGESTQHELWHWGWTTETYTDADVRPGMGAFGDGGPMRAIANAVNASAEADISAAVAASRADGHSWVAIGMMLDTSGEAARQKYEQTTD